MKYILGIDVGTTGTKSVLFSAEGETVGRAYRGYKTHMPRPGWCEQDATDWWNAIVETVREICAGKDVAAISLSTQGGTVVPVDAAFQPLRRALVWNDRRCEEERDLFLQECGDVMYQKSGWGLGTELPCLQIRRIKRLEPEIFEKTAYFLTVPDYVSAKMTGIAAVDFSNAGINQLMDVRLGAYDKTLMAFAGVTEAQLPRLVRSGDVIGHLTRDAAEELGLSTETVLVAGAHDQYAAALGAGALTGGNAIVGSGTCWVITAMQDEANFDSGMAQSVAAVPGLWGGISSQPFGGACLEWMRNDVVAGELGFDVIDAECAKVSAAGEGILYYPFESISNSKTPAGAFLGICPSHGRFHMMRAVMEGVCFRARQMLSKLEHPVRQVKLTGGASKSRFWAQILADVCNKEVVIPALPDLACVGAGILAGTAGGCFDSLEQGFQVLSPAQTVLKPDPETAKMYEKAYGRYCANACLLSTME